jgi:hypothetical protein
MEFAKYKQEYNMKKQIVLCMFLAFVFGGLLFAQKGPEPSTRGARPEGQLRHGKELAFEDVKISGSLGISRGMPSVVSGDTTYLIMGLNRFFGFIDGLKDGATVSLEGQAAQLNGAEKVRMLRASKMTLNGKDYDLGSGDLRSGPRQGGPDLTRRYFGPMGKQNSSPREPKPRNRK